MRAVIVIERPAMGGILAGGNAAIGVIDCRQHLLS